MLQRLLLFTVFITFIFQLLLSSFEAHYALPVFVLVTVLFPLWLAQLEGKSRFIGSTVMISFILFNILNSLQMSRANHGYYMPEGWSLQRIRTATEIITEDARGVTNVNIASLLDGDTRAYPLRYTLDVAGVTLNSEEIYPQTENLYVLSTGSRESVIQSTVWEISSMGPSVAPQYWDLGGGIFLYRLEKAPHD